MMQKRINFLLYRFLMIAVGAVLISACHSPNGLSESSINRQNDTKEAGTAHVKEVGTDAQPVGAKETGTDPQSVGVEEAGKERVPADTLGSRADSLFGAETGDNIWLFTGGETVAAGFEQLKTSRNFIGHFEEYIRWTLARDESVGEAALKNQRQRYTINVGKKGLGLADIVKKWDSLVAKNNPKAVSYFLGREDYEKDAKGLEDFGVQLKLFIDRTLSLKDNKGIAVLQLPYRTGRLEDDRRIELYSNKVREVIEAPANGYCVASDKYERILLINHYGMTKDMENWEEDYLTEGRLNVAGHLEIGRQMAEAAAKTTKDYPNNLSDAFFASELTEEVENYVKESPRVLSGKNFLQVTLEENIISKYGRDYVYEVTLTSPAKDSLVVTGQVRVKEGIPFIIEGLNEGSHWLLQMRTAKGKTQLSSMEGEIGAGKEGSEHQPAAFTEEADSSRKKLAGLLEAKDSVRWLFVGDSITHGNLFTKGYDNISQLFEKYLRQTLQRPDDVVINTAIWAAMIEDHTKGEYASVRLDWDADVVIVMLGTNDAAVSRTREKETFEENFRSLLKEIRTYNPSAMVVIRTPVYTSEEYRVHNLLPVLGMIERIAEEKDETGGLRADFFLDQYKPSAGLLKGFDWLYGNGSGGDLIYGDNIHPNEQGHMMMFTHLIKELGLWDNDSPMAKLRYHKMESSLKKDGTDISGFLTVEKEDKGVKLNVSALTKEIPDLGSLTLRLTDPNTGQSWTTGARREVIIREEVPSLEVVWEENTTLGISGLVWNRAYKVEITGWSVRKAEEIQLVGELELK